jgi:Dirigent-like protein
MKRRAMIGVAAAAVVATWAIHPAADGSARRAAALKLHATVVSSKGVDNPPVGSVGPGDQVLLAEKVTRGGRTVGHTVVACTIVTNSVESQCSFTLTFANGSLQYAGRGTTKNTEHFAIVGGTGAYSKVRGAVTTRETEPGGHDLTFQLR